MKFGQNVYLNDILDKFENASYQLGQILKKLCGCSRGQIFFQTLLKVGPNICLDDISKVFENEVGSKTRSAGQNFQIPCIGSFGHIFSSLLLRLNDFFFFLMISEMISQSAPGELLSSPGEWCPASGVRRLSFVVCRPTSVNNFFKHLLKH